MLEFVYDVCATYCCFVWFCWAAMMGGDWGTKVLFATLLIVTHVPVIALAGSLLIVTVGRLDPPEELPPPVEVLRNRVDCGECGGIGFVVYGPEDPLVKMAMFMPGEQYNCPMCGGCGWLTEDGKGLGE